MKTFLLLLVSLLFCAHQVAADDEGDATLRDECQRYIDELLRRTFTYHEDKLDPRQLEEKKLSFDFSLFLVRYEAEASLYNGTLEGLSKGKRYGDVTVIEKENEDICKATIDFKNIKLKYKATVKHGSSILGVRSITASVEGKPLVSRLAVQVALPKDGGKGEIRSITIDRIGRIRVTTSGFTSWFDMLMSPFIDAMTGFFSPLLKNVMNVGLQDALEEECDKLEYPV